METLKLYRDDHYRTECEAEVIGISEKGILLNQTIFFGEAGGQIGDSGQIGDAQIGDAQHSGGNLLLRDDAPMINVRTRIHHVSATKANLQVGDSVTVKIDWERRYRIMQMHSAGHLVFYFALKLFGPDGVHKLHGTLKGCRLGDDNGRFDFPALAKLTQDDIQRIADTANNFAAQNHDIVYRVDPDEPDLRYWICGDIEMFCGGTHVRNTRELPHITVRRRTKGKGLERVYLEFGEQAKFNKN
ncbi:MAG: alanyl-tRNA editing protein [Chloroflexota bacterium]